jgi:hypothetical protein
MPLFKVNAKDVNKSASTYLAQGQAPRFPHAWLKVSCSTVYLHYDWVIGCTKKLSIEQVTHPWTIPFLSSLTSRLRNPREDPQKLMSLFEGEHLE